MDLWGLVAGVVIGSATTAFGWWLSERSARARQWSSDKRTTYGAFLAAARQLEHTPGVLGGVIRQRLVGEQWGELEHSRADDASKALYDLTAIHAQLWLIAPLDVIDASTGVIDAGTDLFASGPGDDSATEERWNDAKRAFEAAARKDLGIPF